MIKVITKLPNSEQSYKVFDLNLVNNQSSSRSNTKNRMSWFYFKLVMCSSFIVHIWMHVKTLQSTPYCSIVIDRYSNFGNTYLSKEFARVLEPGQTVTSLELVHPWTPGTVPRCSSDVTMWSGPNTRAAILKNKYFQKLYNTYQWIR